MNNLFLLSALIAGLGLIPAGRVAAQTFTTLHSFTAFPFATNSDGAGPSGGLAANSSGNTLYGTAFSAGASSRGTVFAVNADGTGFTNLHNFTGVSDGSQPWAGLILSGNTLYGAAGNGGTAGNGALFALNTNGTGFTVLHNFTATVDSANSDGAYPSGGLISSGNTLYGMAAAGGSSGKGTVFSLSFPPQLTINRSGANVVLAWPTNFAGFDYTGFTLQSTTNLSPTDWSPVAQSAVTNAGQISVTVPTTVERKFFRLKSQ
jgi:uncharacterized repeat protein (TIGR03803 family)